MKAYGPNRPNRPNRINRIKESPTTQEAEPEESALRARAARICKETKSDPLRRGPGGHGLRPAPNEMAQRPALRLARRAWAPKPQDKRRAPPPILPAGRGAAQTRL